MKKSHGWKTPLNSFNSSISGAAAHYFGNYWTVSISRRNKTMGEKKSVCNIHCLRRFTRYYVRDGLLQQCSKKDTNELYFPRIIHIGSRICVGNGNGHLQSR